MDNQQENADKKWDRLVETPGGNASILHEVAVGMLWDAVTLATIDNSANFSVTQADGTETDIMPGVSQPYIPDIETVGGIYPDLGLRSAKGDTIRIVEVIVASPPTKEKEEKLANLVKRGIDVVRVEVKKPEDLRTLIKYKDGGNTKDKLFAHNYKRRQDRGRRYIPMGDDPNVMLDKFLRQLQASDPYLLRKFAQLMRDWINALEELDNNAPYFLTWNDNPVRQKIEDAWYRDNGG